MAIGIANTKLGQIRGVPQEGKYAGNVVFKKVPYAEPPVGENRWKPTVPKKPWDGVYDSTAYADAPYQSYCEVAPYLKDFYYVPSPGQNEDCLYLSVTTGAESPEERRPVYIWFHGGGLSTGYYFETEFDGNELASKGIVVVSVGQRLNTFGYLSLPQLTQEQGKSGNYGFMDQIEAVKWVKDNIAAFGGDPDNITVGGQSGGSQKVCAMAGSPVSNKLFQRCIPHSGLKWLQKFPSQAEAEKAGTAFLEACGIDPSLPLEELRLLPPTAFRPKNGTGLPGSMVCDGELCGICADSSRDHSTICVVESVRDVLSIEATGQYGGVYHVLGGIISPIDGVGPSDLTIGRLVERVKEAEGKVEVILALSGDVEGETTSFYIYRQIEAFGPKVTTLARGLGFGDDLEYADSLTLGRSLAGRQPFKA